jgi:hypothetical protein
MENTTFTKEEVSAAIADAVKEALADIKGKLDSSFKERDAALKRATEAEARIQAAEAERLEKEGKMEEAMQLRFAEQEKQLKALAAENLALTRDTTVRQALTGLPFKSTKAHDMTFREIVEDLVKTDDGRWVHKSGAEIRDFISAYASSEEHAFLFQPLTTTGSGSSSTTSVTSGVSVNTPLSKLPQKEVLRLAEAGKLPNQQG